LLLCCVAPGCLERTVTVISEPPGAVVWLNNTEVGRTPVTTGFLFYGDYDVQVRKEGYEALLTHRNLPGPIYEQPPIDLVATALPVRIQTHKTWNFELRPLPAEGPAEQEALRQRALAMRAEVVGKSVVNSPAAAPAEPAPPAGQGE
jgi:hypothetical protein